MDAVTFILFGDSTYFTHEEVKFTYNIDIQKKFVSGFFF